MKRTLIWVLAAALAISAMAATSFAANTWQGRSFVDADGDGVCDNYSATSGTRPQDGTGRQNGNGNQSGSRFVDADGDGVCDNCTMNGACPQDGTGRQNGFRRGQKRS